MRNFILTLFFLLILACDKKVETSKNNLNDSIIVYNEDVMNKIQMGMIKVIDTACINEEKRAYDDIKNGKIKYYFFNGRTEMYRSNKEMRQILSEYNIEIDSAMTSCIPPTKGFRTNCYISIMRNEIEKRHGKSFIDSIRVLAERKYVINHPNIIFEFSECDTISRYPNTKNYSDFFKKPYVDFSKIFIYPKGYDTRKKEKSLSSTEVSFVLTKKGEVKNIHTDVDFQNPKNQQFEEYFRTKAEEFVKSIKWIPATKKGIKVDSKAHFLYFHE